MKTVMSRYYSHYSPTPIQEAAERTFEGALFFYTPGMTSLPAQGNQRRKTAFYIDGFNLFYGALKGTPHKWLDPLKLAHRLLPHDDIVRVHFCTALVSGYGQARQRLYLDALRTIPEVTVHLGKHRRREKKCLVSTCAHTGSRTFETWEEKFTDVKLGVLLVDEAHRGGLNRVALISGDSDLIPAVETIRKGGFGIETRIFVPDKSQRKRSDKVSGLRQHADKVSQLPPDLPGRCLLSNPVADPSGGPDIHKPTTW